MQTLNGIFGHGQELNWLQMSCRGAAMFFIALILIRVAGRRSFGMRASLDNIIVISVGAILSRAVVGASPFIPVVVCCFVIVLLHRLVGWLVVSSKFIGHLVEGRKIVLYENGQFRKDNLRKALMSEADVMQGVRRSALTGDMDEIDKVYMERNGEISAVRKEVLER